MLKLTEAFLAALKSLVRSTSLIQRLFTTWYIRLVQERHAENQAAKEPLDAFAEDVEHLLGEIEDPERLSELSLALQGQFKKALREDARCMLPSYNHQLPHGREHGTYLALDVGGSTFRAALVELRGPGKEMKIEAQKSYKINDAVKQLKGQAFFDWMAGKIEETIFGHRDDGVLSMGLAWSFPIEYALPRTPHISTH
jgi:hexokinase